MPTCKWVCPKLVALVVGELPERQALAVAAHVRHCPSCREALYSLQNTVMAVTAHATATPDAPSLPSLTGEEVTRLRELVRTGRARPRRPVWAVAMAAVVLGLLPLVGVRLVWPRAVGKVVQVSGRPQIRLGERGWQPLTAQASLRPGGSLRTGDVDQLEVELTDGSRVRVDFGTEVRITTRRDRPWSAERADLYLQHGRVWLLVTAAQSGLRVHTAAVTAEALGTIFEVSSTPHATGGKGPYSEAAVSVFRGEVRVSNQHGSVVARDDTMTQAREGQAPTTPHGITYLRTVRSRARWGNTTKYEVWVVPSLELGGAAQRLAGPRGWLGVELASASLTLSGAPLPGPGLTISRVVAHSPAAQAGLLAGDRLACVGDTPIRARGDLWRSEVLYLPGSAVDLEFRRGDRPRHASVVCAEHLLSQRAPVEPRLAAANRDFVSRRTGEARRAYESLARAGLTAAVHNLGVIDEMAGDIIASEARYREAATRDEGEPRYHYSAGIALARLGNLSAATRELQVALLRAPQYPELRFLLGRLQGLDGDFSAAQEQVAALRADPGTRAQGLCLAGELARLQGDVRASLPFYQQAAAAAPLYPDPPTGLGAAYYALGDYARAELWVQRALALDPGSLRALNRLAQIRTDQGRLREAESLLLRVQAAHPGYAVVFSNLGRVYYRMGRLGDAKRAYQRALAAAPDGADYHVGFAMTLEAGRDFAAAEREYQLALNLDPAYQQAYEQLASLYLQQHDVRSARALAIKAHNYGLRIASSPVS